MQHPVLILLSALGMALVAYQIGFRHGFDEAKKQLNAQIQTFMQINNKMLENLEGFERFHYCIIAEVQAFLSLFPLLKSNLKEKTEEETAEVTVAH